MATVFDVAKYILEQTGRIPALKLQKLVYYSQAWSLVWDEAPIFGEKIEAWTHGPAVPHLFEAHRGRFEVNESVFPQGEIKNLSQSEIDTINSVLDHYGDKTAQWLIDLTHLEDPWLEARKGFFKEPEKVCHNEINHTAMMEYYGGL